jgi:hypothetical protein
MRKDLIGEFNMTSSNGDIISAIQQKAWYIYVHIQGLVKYCHTERFKLLEDYYNTKVTGVHTDATLSGFMDAMFMIFYFLFS